MATPPVSPVHNLDAFGMKSSMTTLTEIPQPPACGATERGVLPGVSSSLSDYFLVGSLCWPI